MAELVLVAGVNYPKYEAGPKGWVLKDLDPGPWRRYCETLAKALASRFSRPGDRITLFDFMSGSQSRLTMARGKIGWAQEAATTSALRRTNYRWARIRPGEDEVNTAKLVPLQPVIPTTVMAKAPSVRYFEGIDEIGSGPDDEITVADYLAAYYEGASPKRPAARCLSIVDVYQYLQAAGEKRPAKIDEVHFFAHSITEGPVLVNTRDFVKSERLGRRVQRDPLDKDGRAKDFESVNMSNEAARQFKDAFGASGRLFLWGCSVDPFAKHLLLTTAKRLPMIADSKFGNERIEYKWNPDWGEQAEFTKSFGTSELVVSKTPNQVKEVIRGIMKDHYAQKLAVKAGLTVAGLPGTSSDYDKPKEGMLELLHISMGPATQNSENVDFRAQLNVYRRLFKTSFDFSYGKFDATFGRGYARFPLSLS
jgi:hypothetical protein